MIKGQSFPLNRLNSRITPTLLIPPMKRKSPHEMKLFPQHNMQNRHQISNTFWKKSLNRYTLGWADNHTRRGKAINTQVKGEVLLLPCHHHLKEREKCQTPIVSSFLIQFKRMAVVPVVESSTSREKGLSYNNIILFTRRRWYAETTFPLLLLLLLPLNKNLNCKSPTCSSFSESEWKREPRAIVG